MSTAEEKGREDIAWREFLRGGHAGDIEDAMLDAAAAFERENPPKMDLTRPTWGEVKKVKTKGVQIEFVEPLDDTTEMKFWRARAEDGTIIEGFIPSVLPEDGLRVRIDGVPGILYLHPQDSEVHLDETEPAPEEAADEEQLHLMNMSIIDMKIVGYNPLNERLLFGVSISNEFSLSLMEAWTHVEHDAECTEVANTYLSRFMEQVIAGLHTGNAKKEGM